MQDIDIIKLLFKQKTITPYKLAELAGVHISAVCRIANGETAHPRIDTVAKLISAIKSLGLYPIEAPPDLPADALAVKRIPLLGKIPAGFPHYCEEDVDDYVIVTEACIGCDFALTVHGDSMLPTLRDGDMVYLKSGSASVQSGDIVAVNNEFGESTLKRYSLAQDGECWLVPDNPEFPRVKPNNHYKIMGRVVEATRKLKL